MPPPWWELIARSDNSLVGGLIFEDVMGRSQLTTHEREAALRQAGCGSIHECHSAILENNGQVSVVRKKDR